jgi:hypothetical protein
MNTPTKEQIEAALNCALALVDFGACRDGDPADWINVASPMCDHCIGSEDVNLAAARILAAAYREKCKEVQQIHKDLGCELRDPNGTIWEHTAKMQIEIAKAQKQRDTLADALREIIIEEEFRDQINGFTGTTAIKALATLKGGSDE